MTMYHGWDFIFNRDKISTSPNGNPQIEGVATDPITGKFVTMMIELAALEMLESIEASKNSTKN
jgi:hypothetical protein